MKWWQSLVLGLTQGLTEFLPVSSSGHLTLLQRVLGIDIGGAELFFNIILHLGTLVAVCIIFWRDIVDLFKGPTDKLLYLIVATIPAAVAGFLLDDVIEEKLMGGAHVGIILALFFTITAVVLFTTEIYARRRKKLYPLSWHTTLPMGLAQAAAILPGISRSGSTIAAGVFAGGENDDVSHFSFLMSIPVILGSFVIELFKGITGSGEDSLAHSFEVAGPQFGWCIAIGFIVSAVAGLFAIKVMLKVIKKANYKWFSLYLILLAAACLVFQFVGLFK